MQVALSAVASVAEVRTQEGSIIAPLRDALKRPQITDKDVAAKDLAQREITIMGDKGTPFAVLKRVMATATASDYGKVSLAVIQREREAGA